MLNNLTTEASNPASKRLDTLNALELVQLMNAEDAKVAQAVALEQNVIAVAMEKISISLLDGGRLIYMGAGTSGRLGVLDAVECIPTFNTLPEQIIGLIAGGNESLIRAVEGIEDSETMGIRDLKQLNLSAKDVVVGIAASGRTPYVIGGLSYAKSIGACCIGFSCNKNAALKNHVDIAILPVVGAEILSGSTRLKSGTATKMVLNMLTTGAMVLMGKTYDNLMVDMLVTNTKLAARANRIIQQLTGLPEHVASELLHTAEGELKTAIVMGGLGVTVTQARSRLASNNGRLRPVLHAG